MEPHYKILGIYNQESVTLFLGKVIEYTNFNMKIVRSCSEALERLSAFLPHIILCDFSLLSHDGNLFMAKIRETIPQVIFIMLLSENTKEITFKAMSYGINNYINYPINQQELLTYLKKYEYVLKSRKPNPNTPKRVSPIRHSITIGNELKKVPEIVESLVSKIHPALANYKCDIQLGLQELIVNAIEHGNLAISYEEKALALQEGSFEKLLEKKKKDDVFKNKRVTVEFHQEQSYNEWTINDEGNGFDPCKISSFSKDSEWIHGRGIMLCRFLFDEIQYFNEGRSIRVRRYVPKNEQS